MKQLSEDEMRAIEEAMQCVLECSAHLVNHGRIKLGTDQSQKLVRANVLLFSFVSARGRPFGMTFAAYLRKHGISWTDKLEADKATKN